MPIPKKIVLFRDRTQCYPVDEDGKVWHVWGGPFGPLCEIIFEADSGEPAGEGPLLVMQDDPDYLGMGPGEFGYATWEDRRTRSYWEGVAPDYEGLGFLAKRAGLDLENPRHRIVVSLLSDLAQHGLLPALTDDEVTKVAQRWLNKVWEAGEV